MSDEAGRQDTDRSSLPGRGPASHGFTGGRKADEDLDGDAEDPDYRGRKQRKRVCQICGLELLDLQQHIRTRHVEWIATEATNDLNLKLRHR